MARTRARRQKSLARCLLCKRIPYFPPLISRPQKSQGRMRVSIGPLFAGYLFFQADAEGRQAALRTGPPAQAMAVADQEKRQRQLQAVFWVCAETVSLELVDFIKPGKPVRIIDKPFWDGPFTGLTGVILRIKNTRSVVLNVDAIGQGVALEIGLKQVQP